MALHQTTRQRLWLGAVLALGIIAAVQYLNNGDLSAELQRTRISLDNLEHQLDDRAGELAADRVEQLRDDVIAAGQWLHAFYQSEEGLMRPEGLWLDGGPDMEGIGSWLVDVYLTARLNGADDAAARTAVVEGIQQSDEWWQKHPDVR